MLVFGIKTEKMGKGGSRGTKKLQKATAKDDLFLKGHGRPTVSRPEFLINLIIFDVPTTTYNAPIECILKLCGLRSKMMCYNFYQKLWSTNCSLLSRIVI